MEKNHTNGTCENSVRKETKRKERKEKGMARKDLWFALIAFEAFILAFVFTFWRAFVIDHVVRIVIVAALAIISVVSLVIMAVTIYKMHKKNYYEFPIKRFAFWAFMLLGITAIISFVITARYIVALILLLVIAIIACIVGYANESAKMFFTWLVIMALVAVILVSYAVANVVHYSDDSSSSDEHFCLKSDYENGICSVCGDEHPCKEKDFKDGKCTICGAEDPDYKAPVEDPCKDGHKYENGKCTVCEAVDPDYQAPVEDPCKDGHKYENGKCTVCDAEDPDYQAPVEDPCKDGHKYENGKCTVCDAEDPDYQAPVEDPCKDGHKYENGKCTVCEAEEPKFIDVPETMSYGKPVHLKLQGIDADNLKYGNEDFISIVKVSDNEVVLTLVGIVNDAGQVEIVPASGYITVTDSVSGVNISIKIVE